MLPFILLFSACIVSFASEFPSAEYHTVDQDHFDGANNNTWQQAYFVNATFWVAGSNAPVFLCVGGEGPALDGSAVVSSPHCNVAVEWLEETGALMFAIEHRYYGCHNSSACPVDNLYAKDALRYLSSRQALGDVAAFHAHASNKYGLTTGNKWVSFGGSYPGMLAGWSRLKFPHLIHAAVASSAPVKAQLDMVGYNDVTAKAYAVSDNGVGGSALCEQNIREGHATIGSMLETTEGRASLASQFGLPSAAWLERRGNQQRFAGWGVADFPAQSNDPSCGSPACNINGICAIMTDASVGDNLARLARVADQQTTHKLNTLGAQNGRRGRVELGSPLWNPYHLDPLLRAASRNQAPEPDYWGYQTCTEFGFYQTCEAGSSCFYTQGLILLEDYTAMCREQYGLSVDKVSENINYTNSYYGALTPDGTRVLYPNGEVDPWSALSIVQSPGEGLPAMWVAGASHHAWTHASRADDQPSVAKARVLIRQQVATWLAEE